MIKCKDVPNCVHKVRLMGNNLVKCNSGFGRFYTRGEAECNLPTYIVQIGEQKTLAI